MNPKLINQTKAFNQKILTASQKAILFFSARKIAIAISALSLLFFATQLVLRWPLLDYFRVPQATNVIDKRFADLASVLNNANCFNTIGISIYDIVPDSTCGGYQYGVTLAYLLSFLGDSTYLIIPIGTAGVLFFAYFTFRIVTVSNPKSFSQVILLICCVLSPPVWLLLERANLDLLILALLSVGIYFLRKGNHALGLISVVISALFKFYTFPLLILIIVFHPMKKWIRIVFTNILIAVLAINLWSIYETKIGFGILPRLSYGLGNISKFVDMYGTSSQNLFLGPSIFNIHISDVIFLIVALLLTLRIFRKQKIKQSDAGNIFSVLNNDFEFKVYLVMFVSTYMAGLSYDYRLVFLLPIFAKVMSCGLNEINGRIRLFVQMSFLSSLWFCYPFEKWYLLSGVDPFRLIGEGTTQVLVGIFLGFLYISIREEAKRRISAVRN
jgi:hypothetical protein